MFSHRRICLPALVLCFAGLANAQTAADFFQKTYQLQQSTGQSLAVLPNDHVITAGNTSATINDPVLLLQRLNEKGELLWAKTYPVAATSQASDILLMNDGNLLVCWSSNDRSGWMKVSPNGDVIWAKRLDTDFTNLSRLQTLSDGNYLITGHRETSPTGGLDAIAIKIDNNGNRLWSNQFGTPDVDALGGCYEDGNGFLHCAGATSPNNTTLTNFGWLAKLGPNGTLVGPVRRFGNSGRSGLSFVTGTTSDRLLLVGYSNGFGNGNHQLWLTEVDGAGVIFWSKTYDFEGEDIGPSDLLQLPGKQFGIILNGLTTGLDNPALLLKLSGSGDQVLIANRYKTNGEKDYIARLDTTSNGFAMAGSARLNGDYVGLVIKTNVDGGVPGCCPESVSFTIKNVTPQTATFVAAESSALTVSNLTNVTPADVTLVVGSPCPTVAVDTDFSLSDSTTCIGGCVQITLPDSTQGTFSFTGGEPDPMQTGRICFPEAGTFFITRQASVGPCTFSTTLPVDVSSIGDQKNPTAFSPDNDGTNDRFHLLFECPPDRTGFLLRVYNRWGEIVYETIDPNEGWDGTLNGNPAPVDVYIWQATVEGVTSQGEVTLLR